MSFLSLLTFYSCICERFDIFDVTCLIGIYSSKITSYNSKITPTKITSYYNEVGSTDT